jgi:hypothetical protein
VNQKSLDNKEESTYTGAKDRKGTQNHKKRYRTAEKYGKMERFQSKLRNSSQFQHQLRRRRSQRLHPSTTDLQT